MSARGILIVCGLTREAARFAHPPNTMVVSGGNVRALERRLQELDPTRFRAVVSFGLAGGLDPSLSVGDVLVPAAVWTPERRYSVDPGLIALWLDRASRGTLVLRSLPLVAGVDKAVARTAEKAALRETSDAVAVDMESHVAAAYALRHGLPFGVLRVISDAANRAVPPAAIAALGMDGGIDIRAFIRSLVRGPGQMPALFRTARDGNRAFRKLSDAGLLLQLNVTRPD